MDRLTNLRRYGAHAHLHHNSLLFHLSHQLYSTNLCNLISYGILGFSTAFPLFSSKDSVRRTYIWWQMEKKWTRAKLKPKFFSRNIQSMNICLRYSFDLRLSNLHFVSLQVLKNVKVLK